MSEPILHNYESASQRMGGVVSAEWLAKHKRQLPHCKFGTKVGFTEDDLHQIIEMFRVRPGHASRLEEPDAPTQSVAPALRELTPRRAGRKKTA